MRFFTADECNAWLEESELGKTAPSDLAAKGISTLRFAIPFDRLQWFSHYIAGLCETFDECLLEPIEWGIWPSSENLHLYYKVRQSYSDMRLLREAPGHLFLNYESEDIATFVQLCLMNLWDTNLATNYDWISVFLSHDEFVEIRSKDEKRLESIREELLSADVKPFAGFRPATN